MMRTTYIDNNVLISIADSKIRSPISQNPILVYSNEHLNEIRRSAKPTRLLQTLDEFKLTHINVGQDEATPEFTPSDLISPFERYEQFIASFNDVEVDTSIFTDIQMRLYGADNIASIASVPQRVRTEIAKLTGAEDNDANFGFSTKLEEQFIEGLKDARGISESREALGTGQLHQRKVDPTIAINEIIDTLDRKFPGSRDALTSMIDQKPRFERIVCLHALLNFAGYFSDKKLAKADNAIKSESDGMHIAYASYCDELISNDVRLVAKAVAIYRYIGSDTKVSSGFQS